ncbi:MAG: cyclic dehypoxanthinyl futalosine synthase [Bacteroidota bacterium]|nr:cyclic dehypoxanthinyl futalosine synthase [Bacteroidota bacterium]
MHTHQLLTKALKKEFLSAAEGEYLYKNVSTSELMWTANELRKNIHPNNIVTWQIDRNVNTTNACIANCKFCNFFRHPKHKEVYITDIDTYRVKIEETIRYGGDQLLLQGGHHPDLGLKFYTKLFRDIKNLFPNIKLHALGPPEVAHICKTDNITHYEALKSLKAAGMDSMPGAGAEILSDRVRRLISKGKCNGQEWLDVMKAAHKIGLTTSATMMFGHIETIEERFDHLVRIREVQDQKPDEENGFLAFIPWPFMDDGTLLQRVKGIHNTTTQDEYLRMIAICRLMLPNIKNIQTSWLTIGAETAQLTLHGGANDMGSIMIEENVVSAAGAPHRFTSTSIQECISEAGFEPQLRTQLYDYRELPEMEEQLITY